MHPEYYRDLIRPVFGTRKWIIATGVVVAATPLARLLRELGASRPFVLAGQIGTGELPGEDVVAGWLSLDITAPGMIENIRATEEAFANLPADARRAIEEFDPDCSAVVLGTPFARCGDLAGRPRYTWRRPEQQALEDKIIADAIWAEAAIEQAPCTVVAVDEAPAVTSMDRGDGVVWAGDAREGHNGGGEYVRWIQDDDDAEEALAFFREHCDVVRVMPFLEGIACSIHGLVFDDDVIAFRPIEMVTLRAPTAPRLRYCGAASFWDPSPEDRDYMRNVARRVGAVLRRRIDYRRGFTVDGVMTTDGFLPTELNPRFGAGLGVLSRSTPDLPLFLVDQCVVAREQLDFRPADLETLIVEAADATRAGGAWTVVPTRIESDTEHAIIDAGNGYRVAQAGEDKDGTLVAGPSGVGGFVRFTPEPGRTPVGPSIAPLAVTAFALADAELGTNLGLLEPALDVR